MCGSSAEGETKDHHHAKGNAQQNAKTLKPTPLDVDTDATWGAAGAVLSSAVVDPLSGSDGVLVVALGSLGSCCPLALSDAPIVTSEGLPWPPCRLLALAPCP